MLSGALESTDGARCDPPGVPDEPRVSALDFLTRKTPAAIPVTTTAAVETPPPVIPSPNVITSCNDEPLIPSQSTSDATETTTQPNPAEAESSPQPVLASVATTLPAISVSRIRAGNGKYKQRILSFARPTAGVPPPTVPRFSTPRPGPSQPVAANDDDKYPRVLTVEQWQQKANEKWLKHFPWLIISETSWVHGRDGHARHAPEGSRHLLQRLVETLVIYLRAQQMKHIRESPYLGIQLDESTDRRRGKHLIVYLSFLRSNTPVTEFFAHLTVEHCDARSLQAVLLTHLESTGLDLERINGISTDGASVMVGSQTGLMARLRGFHCIAHREALAAKDAAEAYPDLDIVDHVVRSLAELLGRSGNFNLRFKELQEVLCETNLELQGIHSELNALNLKFRQRQVDVTHVLQMVDNTRLTLHNRYLSDANDFGDGSNELSTFLSKHASSEKREVKVTGTDSTGAPTTHEYTLHEQNIKGQKSGPGLDDCIALAKGYVKELLKRLESRMKDLGSLDSAKLFTQGAYPKSHSKRQRLFLQWLEALRNLFKRKPSDPDTLPGIIWTRAQKEISSFTTIMSTHHRELSFQDGQKQMLSSPDWHTAYPNLVRLWMAVALLPLSTVECERGFSRQNVIKSWLRGNLNDAKLGDLMTISMLKYEPDWPALVELWRGAKKRRPAKDVVMVHAQRTVKRTRKTLAMVAAKQAAATTAAAAAEAAAREAAAAEEAARLEEELGPWQRRADHGKEHVASDSELDGDDEEYSSHDSDSES
ncbi:unnamed protein product [Closterium sp. NIES-53]